VRQATTRFFNNLAMLHALIVSACASRCLMLLGANFIRGQHESLHFNTDAVRALRPSFVRLVVDDPENITAWAEAARAARVQVLYCLPVERIGYHAARHAIVRLSHVAADTSIGLELGDQPQRLTLCGLLDTPERYLVNLVALSQLAGDRLGPVLLGAGFDNSSETATFTQAMLKAARRNGRSGAFTAITCRTWPNRPLSRVLFAGFANQVRHLVGWRLAFTSAGWQAGDRLSAWSSLKETVRSVWFDGADAREVSFITAGIRDRWTVEAFERAWMLGVTHFVIAARRDRQDGINAWGAYDSISGRPDAVWTRLQWKAAQLAPSAPAA